MPGTYVEFDRNGYVREKKYWEWPLTKEKKPIIMKNICFLNNIVLSLNILFEANPKVDR